MNLTNCLVHWCFAGLFTVMQNNWACRSNFDGQQAHRFILVMSWASHEWRY